VKVGEENFREFTISVELILRC